VFSLDSVITAVGLVEHLTLMAIAIILAVLVMLVAAKSIGDFVEAHPTIKILALSFLILVGLALILKVLASTSRKATFILQWHSPSASNSSIFACAKKSCGRCQITRASERA
jgi:predicted tellurium resistance membrane protein TerC